jgi:hypothetical protein
MISVSSRKQRPLQHIPRAVFALDDVLHFGRVLGRHRLGVSLDLLAGDFLFVGSLTPSYQQTLTAPRLSVAGNSNSICDLLG